MEDTVSQEIDVGRSWPEEGVQTQVKGVHGKGSTMEKG